MLPGNFIKIAGIVGTIGTAIGGAATMICNADSAADKIKEWKESKQSEETNEEDES